MASGSVIAPLVYSAPLNLVKSATAKFIPPADHAWLPGMAAAPEETVADRLLRLRLAFGLSGIKMAEAAGLVTASSVTQWEKGITKIALENATRLCRRFGVTLDWIYRGEVGTLPAAVYDRLYVNPTEKPAKRHRPFSAAE